MWLRWFRMRTYFRELRKPKQATSCWPAARLLLMVSLKNSPELPTNTSL